MFYPKKQGYKFCKSIEKESGSFGIENTLCFPDCYHCGSGRNGFFVPFNGTCLECGGNRWSNRCLDVGFKQERLCEPF